MALAIEEMLTDDVIGAAYAWLCERRKHYPDAADIWNFRRNWSQEREQLRQRLAAGTFRFQLLSRVLLASGEEIDLWSARDALVLKCVALILARHLPYSRRCFHLKTEDMEKKGVKAAVRSVLAHVGQHRFVLKIDVKSYYASMSHQLVMDGLAAAIGDARIFSLVYQYLKRCAERGGLFWEFTRGISLGCPLSPVLGTFFLNRLDVALERLGLFYLRFMDDILVLAPTRWKLREAVRVVNQCLTKLELEKHPAKTFIGRIERGFDFLGYHFGPAGLSVAAKTWQNFRERALRLYEQERGRDPMPLPGLESTFAAGWAGARPGCRP